MERGADPNLTKDDNGNTPLHYLCMNASGLNLFGEIEFMLKNGADANATNNEGAIFFFFSQNLVLLGD